MPAQAVDRACSLAHEVLAVVDEQAQLTLFTLQASDW
jgi:hypothetical protein